MPQPPLQSVVVLGAGTMGARVAAHCANHGLQVALLDLTPALARQGLQAALKSRPAAFFLPALANQVRTGSFDENLDSVRSADWVVEAVVEDLSVKQKLLQRVEPLLNPYAAFTTNTSGLPVHAVGEILAPAIRRRWFGTHFFNPPRYLRLVEIISTTDTDPAIVAWVSDFLDRRLGKGLVVARDTPNFIANRIGTFALLNTLRLMRAHNFNIEQVDALTGPVLGWPKSATFRTLDLVGIDTLALVVRNAYNNLPHDERRELFHVPDFIEEMIRRKWLGDKTGQGFYKRVNGDDGKSSILTLDLNTWEYRPRESARFPSLALASTLDDPAQRLATIFKAGDAAASFLRQALDDLAAYSAGRVPEITEDPGAIDRAMRWGYNWQYGPFELASLVAGKPIAPAGPLDAARRSGAERRRNAGCSLLDLGDGVGCLEFHTKMNAIGADTVQMVTAALTDTASPFDAFVVTSDGENFSAGADLVYLLLAIQNEEWDEIDLAVRTFQSMNLAVKRSPRPVVVAPFSLALGGSCEMILHAPAVIAHAELYTGLVEVGVGLIPAGGGSTQMALRAAASTPGAARTAPGVVSAATQEAFRAAFETIALAKVSTSAAEARQLGYLRSGDVIVANRDRLLAAARAHARQMADAAYEAPAPAVLSAPGPSVLATLEWGVFLLREGEYITAFERKIAGHLLRILCAAGAPAGASIAEERLLDLEREAFLSLCGEPQTRERIQHMLKTGKPLRN